MNALQHVLRLGHFIPFFIFLFLAESVQSQQLESEEAQQSFTPLLGISASYSPVSFKGWGAMRNTRQFFLNLQIIHSSINIGSFNKLEIGSEIIFPSWIHYPVNGVSGPKDERFGIGVIPARLYIPLSSRRHHPLFTTSFGFVVTDRAFPDARGTRLNYMLDLGLGYRFRITQTNAIQFGYKLHHLSNGGSGLVNPGVDSHMFFVSVLMGR